jgi:hypothetical protein
VSHHPKAASGGVHRTRAAGRRHVGTLVLALLVLAALFFSVVSAASAAEPEPVLKSVSVSEVDYSSFRLTTEVENAANYVLEVSTDGVNWEPKGYSAEQPPVGTGTVDTTIPFEPIVENPEFSDEFYGALQPETHYYARISSNWEKGVVYSSEPYPQFTTLGPPPKPTVTIDPVTGFTAESAVFSATVDPHAAHENGAFLVNWHFECEPACRSLSNSHGRFGDDGTKRTFETEAEIEPNTDYTIKIVAENAGVSESAETTFHSLSAPPTAESVPAFAFGDGSEVLLAGKVNPNNSATTYWFQYGPGGVGSPFTGETPVKEAGADFQNLVRTETLSSLEPNSEYHFRVVTENANGKTLGNEVAFKTLPVPAAPPASCPNEKLRSETNSEQLDECRAYEAVSPADKNGGDVLSSLASSPDGNRIGYVTNSGFANPKSVYLLRNNYLAIRTSSGWETRPMSPSMGTEGISLNINMGATYFNKDLTRGFTPWNAAPSEPQITNIAMVQDDGSETWITKPSAAFPHPLHRDNKCYVGASADGSRVFFESGQPFEAGVSQPPFDPVSLTGAEIWEWHEGEVRLASAMPDGTAAPLRPSAGTSFRDAQASCFITTYGWLSQPTAVSEDGNRIFWSVADSEEPFSPRTIYVRENATETREIVPASAKPEFLGAATDGSSVVFFSPEELTGDATPGGGIYRYNLESDELSFLTTGASTDAGARVDASRGAVVSDDASHVYFVAKSLLDGSRGVVGGLNLYVSGAGGPEFIATLTSSDGEYERESPFSWRKSTPDGRFYFFESFGRLTAFDNAGHSEIYRYDTDRQILTCVTCGDVDEPAQGDATMRPDFLLPGGFPRDLPGLHRAISSDGDKVLFQTTQSLVPADVNGRFDVYLWDAGRLSLISTGTSNYPAEVADISPDGRDVSFVTRDSLVGQDTDGGGRDIYDARVDGGFPAPPAPNPCETAEACQKQPAAPPAFTPPASGTPGLGNSKHPKKSPCKKQKASKKAKGKCGSKGRKHRKKKGRRDKSTKGRGK